MKNIAITGSLLVVVLGLVSALNCSGTKPNSTSSEIKPVSAETISQLPPGKTFEIDLTKKGIVYQFDDDNTDFQRVSVRTAAGVKPFAELLNESKANFKGGVLLGTPDDMRNHLSPSSSAGTTNYVCGVFCKCEDTLDCIGMIASGKCGFDFWCSKHTTACFCTAKG